MVEPSVEFPGSANWRLAEIPYQNLNRGAVQDDELLFYILASASFIEITSDLYTRSLVEFFAHDAEVTAWLQNSWEKEELQHGVALRRYVQAAWPDFDWEVAYRNFYGEFQQFCSVDQLARTRALEMAARCVVETGTASFYRMLAEASPEPVLRQLANCIRADEVRHYKHFYRHFLRYQERERPGRRLVLRTLWKRMSEIDAEDAFYAFKHVYLARHPGASFSRRDYAAFRTGFRHMAKRHFPCGMAIKMLLKPLGLKAAIGAILLPVLAAATRLLFR